MRHRVGRTDLLHPGDDREIREFRSPTTLQEPARNGVHGFWAHHVRLEDEVPLWTPHFFGWTDGGFELTDYEGSSFSTFPCVVNG